MYFYDLIQDNRSKLNPTEDEILQYLLEHADQSLTIREVAKHFYVAPNTVTRLMKKLQFRGYTDFINAQKITTYEQQSVEELHPVPVDELIIKTKQLVNPAVLNQVVTVLHDAPKLLVAGVGLSHLPAEELTQYLNTLGKPAQLFTDPHLARHAATLLGPGDVCIGFSVSGDRDNVLDTASIAKTKGATLISLTGFSINKLAKMSSLQLYAQIEPLTISGLDTASRLGFYYLNNQILMTYLSIYDGAR